ncbi:hypothetical protein pdam_00006521, partial [Pocillopora damicornis]
GVRMVNYRKKTCLERAEHHHDDYLLQRFQDGKLIMINIPLSTAGGKDENKYWVILASKAKVLRRSRNKPSSTMQVKSHGTLNGIVLI